MKKTYFKLNEGCFLIKGILRGAVYNLNSGDVYSIDKNSLKIIDFCEKGKNISEIVKLLNGEVIKDEIVTYLSKLQEMKLGHSVKNKITKIQALPVFEQRLNFAWLELTSNCNVRCLHCYNSSGEKSYKELELDNWKKILLQIKEMGCKRIQFTGGEVLLRKSLLFQLIKFALKLKYEFIEVFTNAVLLTNDDVKFFQKYDVKIAISFYSKFKNIHEQITQQDGSYKKSLDSLVKIQKAGLSLRVAVIVVTEENKDSLNETVEFLKEFGVKKIKSDIARPFGRNQKLNFLLKESQVSSKNFPKISRFAFSKRQFGHCCYADKLCIAPNGDVFPCIMGRIHRLGNIQEINLNKIWNNNQSIKFRTLSKDKIKVCKDCEYRYACFDCRARINMETGYLYSKPTQCPYNPYTGIWR